LPSLRNSNWEVRIQKEPAPAVEFRFVLDSSWLAEIGAEGELEFVKRYRMAPAEGLAAGTSPSPGHHLQVELELVNRGSQPLKTSYRLDGPNGLPLEGWWYLSKIHPRMFASAGARDIVYGTAGQMLQLVGCPEIFSHAQKNPATPARSLFAESEDEPYRTLRYMAVDTQYFVAALLPQNKGPYKSDVFRRAAAMALGDPNLIPKARIKTANTSFHLVSPIETIEPGKSIRRDFLLYAGPKSPSLLTAYGLEECTYYGWFGWVAKPLSKLLHFFHALVGNFGLAIVMLTVLVRGCMFPLSRKAAKNAAMMQELAPEMRKIAENTRTRWISARRPSRSCFARTITIPSAAAG